MANNIESYVRNQVVKLNNSFEHLKRLQAVTAGCKNIEDLEDLWLLRQHFMSSIDDELEQLSLVLMKEVLPLVADIKTFRVT